ncbi:MAG: ABC transporter ATP-binding protein [Candidatus Phytoplasma pruni]|nr:ABC transporter ATP-binding protein [Candidatus Phytoplasma pruni]
MFEKTVLDFNNISFTFPNGFETLRKVNFKINKNEIVGLVGESGSGKTTIGKIITGIHLPTKGKLFFHNGDKNYLLAENNKKIKDNRKLLLSEIQMIFQNPEAALNPRALVKEILAEGLYAQKIKDKQIIDEKIKKMITLVGLNESDLYRSPHQFLGGQQQRIAIARSLIVEPKLIVADEPVSALDVSIQAQIINLLKELNQKLSLTMLFISHDLSIVKYFCNRIIVIYKGKIVEEKTSDLLFSNPEHPYTKKLIDAIYEPDPHKYQK